MDQQQGGSYKWMWTPPTATKRKADDFYESWEERAFAEDASSVLGCVWPPRSYTCSFCRREFRSAQALGGHMNVHRRDRARLKELPNTPQQHQQQQPSTPITPFFKPDRNYIKYPSTSPNPNNSHTLLPSHEQGPNLYPNYCAKEAKIVEVEYRDLENEGANKHKCVINSELSISLNLVVRRNWPEEEASCFKRRKIVAISSPEASPPLIFVDHKNKISVAPREVLDLNNCSSSSREIDLELRLGG